MHPLHYNYSNVFMYINRYMFLASLAHHHAVHSYMKHQLGLFIISRTWLHIGDDRHIG